jgi:cell division protein FtsW (lipid II flippase)
VSPQRPDRSPEPNHTRRRVTGIRRRGPPQGQNWRWLWGVAVIGIIAILLAVIVLKTTNAKQLSYTKFLQDVRSKQVNTAQISNGTGRSPGS